MNPIMMQQLSRSDNRQRAGLYAEIRLINQAFPGRQRSDGAWRGSVGRSLGKVRGGARRLQAWFATFQAQSVEPAEGTHVSG